MSIHTEIRGEDVISPEKFTRYMDRITEAQDKARAEFDARMEDIGAALELLNEKSIDDY